MRQVAGWLRPSYAGLPDRAQLSLRRLEVVVWVFVLAYAVCFTAVDAFFIEQRLDLPSVVHQVLLRAALRVATLGVAVAIVNRVVFGRIAAHLQEDEERRALSEKAAQLETVLLTTRTMQHHLNNQLALTVGYCELLTRDPGLPERLRDHAAEARRGAEEASRTLAALAAVTDVRTNERLGTPLIEIERSEPVGASEARQGHP